MIFLGDNFLYSINPLSHPWFLSWWQSHICHSSPLPPVIFCWRQRPTCMSGGEGYRDFLVVTSPCLSIICLSSTPGSCAYANVAVHNLARSSWTSVLWIPQLVTSWCMSVYDLHTSVSPNSFPRQGSVLGFLSWPFDWSTTFRPLTVKLKI